MYKVAKNYKLAMSIGLSFTILTLVAAYSMVSDWVKVEEWSSLLDVVPRMEIVLWFLTIISILLNITPTVFELKNTQKGNNFNEQIKRTEKIGRIIDSINLRLNNKNDEIQRNS